MSETNVYISDYKALKILFPQKRNNRKNGAICQEIMTKNIRNLKWLLKLNWHFCIRLWPMVDSSQNVLCKDGRQLAAQALKSILTRVSRESNF